MNTVTAPTKPAWASTIRKGQTLICMIDEWHKGDKQAFDGQVTWLDERGVDVCYLSGYRSRNDHVPWADIVARFDKAFPRITVADGAFEGHFEVFTHSS